MQDRSSPHSSAPPAAVSSTPRAQAPSATAAAGSASPTMRAEATATAATATAATDDGVARADAAVARINRALHQLVDADQVPNADHVPKGHAVHVCRVTEDEWTAYVESEDQAYRSRFLHWDETSKEISIDEFPGTAHESFVAALGLAMLYWQDAQRSLKPTGAMYDSVGSKQEPDLSYRPVRRHVEPHGVVLPRGEWDDFKTLRAEIGVIQPWQQLERKALDV